MAANRKGGVEVSPKKQGTENRQYLVCVDCYVDSIPQGRVYDAKRECVHFRSLSQFLLHLDQLLDQQQSPQTYTEARCFFSVADDWHITQIESLQAGTLANFELTVLFRQHSSWQGILLWKEHQLELHFRSVLELVHLLDNALRSQERSYAILEQEKKNDPSYHYIE